MAENRSIWFPAKTYGWGWGPPVTWQGWVVTGVYAAAVVASAIQIAPAEHPFLFAGVMFALTAAFIAVCYAKGEKPGWRARNSNKS